MNSWIDSDELVGHVSLRNLGSRWLDERWSEESSNSQLKRLLSLLIERVFVVETGEDTEEVSLPFLFA